MGRITELAEEKKIRDLMGLKEWDPIKIIYLPNKNQMLSIPDSVFFRRWDVFGGKIFVQEKKCDGQSSKYHANLIPIKTGDFTRIQRAHR